MDEIVIFPADAKDVYLKLDKLWQTVNSQLINDHINLRDELRFLVLMSITGAIHRLVRGILTEIKGGSVDGLDLMSRSIIEGLITVKYVIEDDTQMRSNAYIAHDHTDRINALKRLIPISEKQKNSTDTKNYKQLLAQLEKELTDLKKLHGEKNLIWPTLELRAKASGNEELYATAVWLLSSYSHMTVRALDHYMKQKEDGGIVIELGQDLSRTYMNLASVYTTYLTLLNECSIRIGIPKKEILAQFDII